MNESFNDPLLALLSVTPYARFLGMNAIRAGDEMTAILPFSRHLIGNTQIPALHGAVDVNHRLDVVV